jgi:large subunit ribosomal protein L4
MTASTPSAEAPTAPPPLVREVTEIIRVPVLDRQGQPVDQVEIDPALFGGKINRQLMHDVVLMYLANQRAGTHHTLRRGEVAGSTRKLFRQKGTGYARVGSIRTNKRRGGGTAKGPKPRDYEYHLPKKAVRAATRMAVLSKFVDQEVVLLDDLSLPAPKTREMAALLQGITIGTRTVGEGDQAREQRLSLRDTTVLIGTPQLDQTIYRAARNLPGVRVLPVAEFNCYTVLRHKRLLLSRAALQALLQKYAAELNRNKQSQEQTPTAANP